MDPRSSKPNTRPTVRRDTSDTDTSARSKELPLNAGDAFLAPPKQPDEVGRLGPYRVLGVLGRGGMGTVYRAEDPRLNRQLAIKVLLPELSADARARARFLREAQAQAKVDHDNIIPIYEVEQANGVVYIAMPLLRGQTLGAALKANPRAPVNEVARIGREAAEGLAAAHAVGLIHRDIKPANIWLEGSKRRVKVLDFGLARGPAAPEASPPDSTEPITAVGVVMGTPAYMSPEQARSQPVDHRSDIFSLGVVLYEMATGRKPFTGPSAFDVMSAVVTHEPMPAHEQVPGFSPALGALIGRMMAKHPHERPQSAEAVAEELESIERGLAVLPVQVFPLSAIPGEPDPWAEIETTYAESVTPSPYRTRAERPVGASARPKWLLPAAGAVGALLLVGLVALAVSALLPKPKPEVEEAKPKEPTKPKVLPPKSKDTTPPIALSDRAVAEWVLKQKGGRNFTAVHIRRSGADKREGVYDPAKLPPGPFTVVGVTLDYLNDADEPKLAEVFAALGDLELLQLDGKAWTDARLATAIGALKGKKVEKLEIWDIEGPLPQTSSVCQYLATVTWLQMTTAAENGVSLDGISQVKVSKTLRLGDGLTDASLAQFPKFPNWPETLILSGNKRLGDEGIAHIRPINAARETAKLHIDLTDTAVTADGVNALADRLPESTVIWKGGTVGPVLLDRQRAAAQAATDRAANSVMLYGGKYVKTAADVTATGQFRALWFASGGYSLAVTPTTANSPWEAGGVVNVAKPFTAAELAELLPYLPCQEVRLYAQNLTDAGAADMLRRIPGDWIVGLFVTNCDVGDETAKAVALRPSIATLDLNNTKITDAGVKHLAGKLPKLNTLRLMNTAVTDAAIDDLVRFAGPHNIDLKGTQVTEVGAKKLAALCPRTWIRYGPGTVIEPGKALTRDEALKELFARGASVWNGGNSITDPAKFSPNLVSLTLESGRNRGWEPPHHGWEGKEVQGPVAKPFDAPELAGLFTDLKIIDFRYLTFTRQQVTDDGLRALLALPAVRSLQELHVSTCAVGDGAAQEAATLPALTAVNFDDTKVGDAGVKALAGNLQLARLRLRNCPVTDAAVPHLKRLLLLTELDLKGTKITAAKVEELAAALPYTHIRDAAGKALNRTRARLAPKDAQQKLTDRGVAGGNLDSNGLIPLRISRSLSDKSVSFVRRND